jgi:hypothetical protein
VTPSVSDGAPGPTNPTASPTNTFAVYLSSTSTSGAQEVQATTPYIGLAPDEVAGLAQINFTIPSVTSGDNVVEIVGPDSDTFMALISVGSGSNAAIETAKVAGSAHLRHPVVRAKRPTPGAKAKPLRPVPASQ